MGFDKKEISRRLESKRIAIYQKSKKMTENKKIAGSLIGTGPVGAVMYVAGTFQGERCPRCKEKVEKKARFCPECGLSLEDF